MKTFRYLAVFTVLWLAMLARADEAAVGAVLDRLHQAAARADSAAYLALLTPDVVFLGTDGSERWQGQAFREFVLARFDAGEGWEYLPVSRNIRLSADGKSAWFDETLHNAALGQCRGSGVLVRDGSGWKIAQYNLSVPIPNALLPQVVAQIAAAPDVPGPAAATPVIVGGTGSPAMQAPPTVQPAAESAATGERDDDVAPTGNCTRKRFKTNRKADCDPMGGD